MSLKDQARDALVAIKDSNPKEYKIIGNYLAGLLSQNVAVLGNGEVFTLQDESGKVIATKQQVHLSAADGTLIQPVKGGPWVLGAPGYLRVAEASGAVCMNAPTVVVDGETQHNPYCRRDEQGNAIEVHCRAVAFRYGPGGNPIISDRTAVFDLRTYLKSDMIGKAKYTPTAFKLRPKGSPPEESGTWCEYNIDFATSLYMNVDHDEATKFIGQILNRQKKAVEFAQTFAQRNAYKHLFGITKTPEDGKYNQWSFDVTAWRPDGGGMISFSNAKFAQAVNQINAMTQGEKPQLPEGEKPVQIVLKSSGTDRIETEADLLDGADVEDQQEALDAEFSSTAQPSAMAEMDPIPGPEDEPEPQEELDGYTERAWENVLVAKDNYPEELDQALQESGLEFCPENAAEIMSVLNSIMS